MGPWLYEVELSIGGQQFRGKGRTRQAAKHDAAAKALKILQNEPLPEKPEVVHLKHPPAPLACVLYRLLDASVLCLPDVDKYCGFWLACAITSVFSYL